MSSLDMYAFRGGGRLTKIVMTFHFWELLNVLNSPLVNMSLLLYLHPPDRLLHVQLGLGQYGFICRNLNSVRETFSFPPRRAFWNIRLRFCSSRNSQVATCQKRHYLWTIHNWQLDQERPLERPGVAPGQRFRRWYHIPNLLDNKWPEKVGQCPDYLPKAIGKWRVSDYTVDICSYLYDGGQVFKGVIYSKGQKISNFMFDARSQQWLVQLPQKSM